MTTGKTWTRRKLLYAGGALMLAPTVGCVNPASTVAVTNAARVVIPWAGQFLWNVGIQIVANRVDRYIDGLSARERPLADISMDALSGGGFDKDVTEAFPDLQDRGVGDIYETDGFKAVCRVDPVLTTETCLVMWYPAQRRSIPLEGPVLGALTGTGLFLRNEGFSEDEIAKTVVPTKTYKSGTDLRFTTESAVRDYDNAFGQLRVGWARTDENHGLATVSSSNLPDDVVIDVPVATTV